MMHDTDYAVCSHLARRLPHDHLPHKTDDPEADVRLLAVERLAACDNRAT